MRISELRKQWFSNKYHSSVNNPFKGKQHTAESKLAISKANTGKLVGDRNPFYGKRHSNELLLRIAEISKVKNRGEGNHFFHKKHTEHTKSIISKKSKQYYQSLSDEEKLSRSYITKESQRKLKISDPDYYMKKRKGGIAAAKSHTKYKKNKLEIQVEDKLKEIGIDMQYSVILDYKQFDFGNKEARLLLEVQGDYWHGNPLIFGEGKKRPLSEKQIIKQARDNDKQIFAKKHGIKLFVIWESDILMDNWEALKELKREFDKFQVDRNCID